MPLRTSLLALAVTLAASACTTTAATHSQPAAGLQVDVPQIRHPDGETPAWWFRAGAAQAAERGASHARAKNVILFVGDGMSLSTVAAARILDGQRKGASGEENRLSWENFPFTALSKTYNVDSQTPDSASTMSAMATGVKTRTGVLSIGQDAARGDCAGALRSPMMTLWEMSANAGMATGVVTTTRITHATPGATIAHSPDRNWENDVEMPAAAATAGCRDIARQIVESPYAPRVLMGGGRANFLPNTAADPEYPEVKGLRRDGRDLIADWQQRHPGGRYVWNAAQLAEAPSDAPLLALFEPSHMHFEHDRGADKAGEPSLAEMTRSAIERLRGNPNGYVLLVEGGRIDHAHHLGNAYRALTDTVALSEAVAVAARMTSTDDTLIVVTADHSHTLSFVGYPVRGNPILGKVKGSSGEGSDPSGYATDATGLPYTTLNYMNGPGYVGASKEQPEGPKRFEHKASHYQPAKNGRPDLTQVDTEDPDYMQEAIMPLSNETHGGDDVGVWARGPGSDAVRGSLEQNAIFHILLQSLPKLRGFLCAKQLCDAHGVPVALPRPELFPAK